MAYDAGDHPSEITRAWLNTLKKDRREGREPDSAGRYSYKLPIRYGKKAHTVCVKISPRYVSIFSDVFAPNLKSKIGVDEQTGLPIYRRGQMRKCTVAKFSVSDPTPITSTQFAAIKSTLDAVSKAYEKVTPAKQRDEKKQTKRALMTNRELIKIALEFSEVQGLRTNQKTKTLDGKPVSPMEYVVERYFLSHRLAEPRIGASTFGDVPPSEVDSDEAIDWLEKIRKEHGFHTARLAQAYTSDLSPLGPALITRVQLQNNS